ncbi:MULTISPECIES: ArnT family glycosyltransferase [unclassified Sporolactobacillus]|uniref:ArnT family glycosyltransferase n=1 Tax=unclassified Sporolactobacillus TaxID=2628533 RepID=UPI002367786E|nr:glycosyltransferase family 39 protein [Sporolactobacillus sp. CQH2019]MDD9148421.1 glycosyltransferase family 39 protein [Sporolactobacillus sp. CQH2019]
MDRVSKFNKPTVIYLLTMAVLFVVAIYNLFYHLGSFPFASYDESRHGASAYEMLQSGNYLVNTYMHHTDYWNLKPPLSFWSIMLGYKIAGFNALGLRLASAVCALLTIVMVAAFTLKKHGKLASAISALVLITCIQFLTNHSARTGDPDSLYVFLFTAAILALLLSGKNNRWIYVSGLGFSLAFLTKSWHSFNIAAIIGIYLIFSGKYKSFSFKNWFLLALSMFAPIMVWAVFRYQYDGLAFFKGMVTYDLLTRSTRTIEGHIGGWLYYAGIISHFFIYWLAVLYGLILVFLSKRFSFQSIRKLKPEERAYWIGMIAWIIVPLIFFSLVKTKIRWYILPIYPALSIVIAIFSARLLQSGRWMLKIFLLASVLLVSVSYELKINNYLTHIHPSVQLELIQKLRGVDGIKGDSLFYYNRKKVWPQNAVLEGELIRDLHANKGNFNEFLRTDKALLLVQKKYYTPKLMKANRLKIMVSNPWGFIVYKYKRF